MGWMDGNACNKKPVNIRSTEECKCPPPKSPPGPIEQIYLVRPGLKLPKTAIHKILFKVRVALPEKDRQREQIPFYWYRYGP